jgi:D-serine dehydratase
MLPELEVLTAEETETLKNAFPLVTLLIAGADGTIDAEETQWATELTKIRGFDNPKRLQPFYDDLQKDFSKRLKSLLSVVSLEDTAKRNQVITAELTKLNDIFAKIDQKYAANFHKDLLSFADHIARASGGILRFGSVSAAEKKLIGLSMIQPIVLD